jgi:hypothetical protein
MPDEQKKRLQPNRDIIVEGLSKPMENLTTAGVPAEIRTGHLPNTSLEQYCYINLFNS